MLRMPASRFGFVLTALLTFGFVGAGIPAAFAADAVADEKGTEITIASGAKMMAPANWKVVRPKISIIQNEFAAPGAEPEQTARVTMMAASGSVQANVDRWKGQFQLAAKDGFKEEQKTIEGHTLHLVDLQGTFNERMGGPFAGGRVVHRENYAMAGAILIDPNGGKFFIKMTGPVEAVKANRKAFGEMLDGLKK